MGCEFLGLRPFGFSGFQQGLRVSGTEGFKLWGLGLGCGIGMISGSRFRGQGVGF